MAFDWTKVAGYQEGMSPEEMVGLLSNYEEPESPHAPVPEEPKNGSKTVPKSQFDKLSSELAALKKQNRARMTEEEQREEDRKAEAEAMRLELETLRKEKQFASYKASFLAQGYDDSLAHEAASAMSEGDTDGMFAVMAKQRAIAEKALKAQLLKDTPRPPAGEAEEIAEKERENKIRISMGLKPR